MRANVFLYSSFLKYSVATAIEYWKSLKQIAALLRNLEAISYRTSRREVFCKKVIL